MRKAFTIILVAVIASGCTTTGIQKEHREQASQTQVVEVVDGDTVDINLENQTEAVRLVGVDTPEVHVENSPGEFEGIPDTERGRQCLENWGEKASEFARETVGNEQVTFQTDPETDVRGSYGRLLGYIRNDGENFNYILVKQGYARVYESGFSKQEKFLEAEQKAQEELKGLWQCRSYEVGNMTLVD